MKIEHFGGIGHAADSAALDEILSVRFGDDANEFWLSGDERHPLLSINVRKSLACVHFFPQEDHPGFVSCGDSGAEGHVAFRTNTPTEELEIAAELVVPFELARQAARQFMVSRSKPSALKWLEL